MPGSGGDGRSQVVIPTTWPRAALPPVPIGPAPCSVEQAHVAVRAAIKMELGHWLDSRWCRKF